MSLNKTGAVDIQSLQMREAHGMTLGSSQGSKKLGPLLKQLMPDGRMYTLAKDKAFPNGQHIYLCQENEKVGLFFYSVGQSVQGYYFDPAQDQVWVFTSIKSPAKPGTNHDRKEMQKKIEYFQKHCKTQELVTLVPKGHKS